ncbi:TetR/AcrR family transcriptional regulator [Micromonosporaceae bacterium Da 78-11]
MTTTPGQATGRRGRPPSGGRAAILRAAVDLLRERGASRLTTKEVARRAGVAEGSVFYHFTDRAGLLTAVIDDGLTAVQAIDDGIDTGAALGDVLDDYTSQVQGFLGGALTVMIAAQSDFELRAGLIDNLHAKDMGPHRGIDALAAYVRDAQLVGTLRPDVDPAVIAYLVYSTCFQRVAQQEMLGADSVAALPDRRSVIDTVARLLTPPNP